MRKFLVPAAIYVAMSAAYLGISGAPDSVHALSLGVLAMAFLVPSIWAAHLTSLRQRLVVCAVCAAMAMLSWDVLAHLVIAKAEPFFVLRTNRWLYGLGGFALSVLSLSVSWLAAPDVAARRRTSR